MFNERAAANHYTNKGKVENGIGTLGIFDGFSVLEVSGNLRSLRCAFTSWVLCTGLLFVLSSGSVLAAPLNQDLPAAEIENDEGGPIVIVGEANYTDFSIPLEAQEPVPALLDMSAEAQRDYVSFAPVESQILGYLTTPIAPAPAGYAIPLPIEPTAQAVDVDNDGEEDTGVQIFRLALAANITGGSYLVQLDQLADLKSYLTDPITGEITTGSMLLYTDDDVQGFPSSAGDDGLFFTSDDLVVGLPQGYTVATLNDDGTVTFDRSKEGRIDVLEKTTNVSPDFSDQGILESFNSLMDILTDQYAYTELRQLDWDEIRETYLPSVDEADAEQNIIQYFAALHDLAQSIRDAHVVTALQGDPRGMAMVNAPIAANLGAGVIELSDGSIVVTEIVEGSAADEAGLVFGAEIVSINGQPVSERIPTVRYTDNTGTEEGQRLRQVRDLLKFPANAEVQLEYRLPDTTETMTATLTAGSHTLADPIVFKRGYAPIAYDLLPGGYGYITWNDFVNPIPQVDVYADFLQKATSQNMQGMIFDLRSNSGGWDNQYFTMASYLFDAENPVAHHWIDEAFYDTDSQSFVPEFVHDYQLSAPKPDLYYDGDVVILVDGKCASSCEFFTQFLQNSERVTVVGQYATEGAGGPINRVAMPGGIIFQYTKGRTTFAGTDTLNLEAKGVQPDVRVPVTLESEHAILNGADPVLQAGTAVLDQLAGERLRASINLVPVSGPDDAFTSVMPEGWVFSDIVSGYISPSQTELIVFKVVEPPVDDLPAYLATLQVVDMESAYVEDREANGLIWSIYAVPLQGFVSFVAVSRTESADYVIAVTAQTKNAEVIKEAVLDPAIDAFVGN